MNRRAILIPLALACLAALAAVAIAAGGADTTAGGARGGASTTAGDAAVAGRGTVATAAAGARARSVPVAAASRRRQPASSGRAKRRLPARTAGRQAGAGVARSPGSLPQTGVRPSARTPQFHAQMRALWAGIATGSLAPALPAFFPRGAYTQLKAIASAGTDWQGRLVHDYRLDIRAAHALLRGDPSAALLAVDVRSSYAHWVPPGVCLNRVGYYEVPNARVVYRTHGVVRSFGIASMISWRGVWYVVHLGAILRSGGGGEVDEPSAGRGVSAYSGTC
ncbi:MAG TPA: hypothetical protein VGN13_08905 [Solirubrobacteraceae bacterium]|jgi:hypothetical protein